MSPPRIVTVTLNPAYDRHYSIPGFGTEGVFRAASIEVNAGGKGINVARVWKTLGGDAIATGLLGGRNGAAIAEKLTEEVIDARFLPIDGETRLALSLYNPDDRSEVIVNEAGPDLSEFDPERFLSHLRGLLVGAAFLAISGSAPPGVPVDIYSRMVEQARSAGIKAAVDASGDALLDAVAARPSVVKPNREEAKALGTPIESWADAAPAALELRNKYGIDFVVITGGPDGAVCASIDGVWSAKSPSIEIMSTLGSGDSTLAGFLWGLCLGQSGGEALRLAVACGSANALTVGAGRCSAVRIAEMSGKIDLVKLR